MSYTIYIALGLAPSIIWLLFFLSKDSHPESNRMIIMIFFFGAISAIAAAIVEIGIALGISGNTLFNPKSFLALVIYSILGIALVEETFKYLVIRFWVLKNKAFDEPIDAMLYMIIAALGFAALENILVLISTQSLQETINVSILRFLGATFLHALASGLVGYFLALSIFETKKRSRLLLTGLGAATLLHGLYNISIMALEGRPYLILVPVIILIGLAFFVSAGFRKIRKLPSVCKII